VVMRINFCATDHLWMQWVLRAGRGKVRPLWQLIIHILADETQETLDPCW